MTPHWTMSEAIARAFPGAPVAILLLLEKGDLQRAVPDWMNLLVRHYDEYHGNRTESRLKLAWSHVLRAYDARVGVPAAEEE